ncbi:MAG: oligosaccharide flippase family protein [Acidimicrobiales bacterium]
MADSPLGAERRVAYGAGVRLLGRTLGALFSLVALREATRYFGPVQWGPITAALAWFGIFSLLGTPGVAMLAMRELAKPDIDVRRTFGRSLAATCLVSIAALVPAVVIGTPIYAGKGTTLEIMLVIAAGIPAMALFMTSSAALAGRGRSDIRALLDVVSSIFLLVATLVVVHAHLRQLGYATAYLCYLAVTAVVAVGLTSVLVPPRLGGSHRRVWTQLRQSLPLGQFDIFAAVYARADSIMLFFIKGSRPVALYGVAFQIVTFLFVTPSLLSNALLPDYVSAGGERRRFLARRGFDVMLTLALPLPVFGVVFGRALVVWIAGNRFAPAGTLLAILSGAALLAFLSGYLFQMAIFSGAEKGLWRAVAALTAVNIASNAVAVTLWSATGAATAMILSEAVGLVIYWRIYRASLPSPLGRRYPLSVLVAASAFAGLCAVLKAGLHLSSGSGAGILPRGAVLFAFYLIIVGFVAAVARRLSSRVSRTLVAD